MRPHVSPCAHVVAHRLTERSLSFVLSAKLMRTKLLTTQETESIAMNGHPAPGIDAEFRAAGASTYSAKPLSIAEVPKTIEEVGVLDARGRAE